MEDRIELRQIVDQDRAAFESMAEKYFLELDSSFRPTKQWSEGYFKAATQVPGSCSKWVVSSGQRVGLVVLRTEAHRYRAMLCAFIDEFYIVPGERRKGIGQEAIKLLLGQLRTKGVLRVDLSVLVRNEAAHAFWRQCGFELVSTGHRRVLGEGT